MKPIPTISVLMVVLVSGFSAMGCRKLATLAQRASSQTEAQSDAPAAAQAEPALITGAAGPAGYQWSSTPQAELGALELPQGSDWKTDGNETANEKLDITIMIQSQAGIEASDRAAFLDSLVKANQRQAPKYEVTARTEGQINKSPAGRVDGKFDNGTAYATRDYVLFVKNTALAVMVRGPVARQSEVQSLADRIAASFK